MAQNFTYTTQNHAAGKGSWIIAIFGTVLVIGALYYSDMVLETLRLAQLQDKLLTKLEEVDNSKELLNDRELGPILVSAQGTTSAGLKEIFHTLELVESQKFDRALVKVKERKFPKILQKEELLSILEEIDETKNSTDESIEQMARLNRKKQSLQRQLELISDDMMLIFNKETVSFSQEPEWEEDLPELYSSGPLHSLPIFDGIPEGLSTKEDLAPYLEGSYVSATETHLDNLRNRMAKLNTEVERYQFIVGDARAGIENTTESLNGLKDKTRGIINSAIFELAKPKLDDREKWVYDHVSTLASKIGYEMPKVAVREKRRRS